MEKKGVSLAKYLGGLTKENAFMAIKGRTKTPTLYVVIYRNVNVPAVKDENGVVIKKQSSRRMFQKTIGKVLDNNRVEFYDEFLAEHEPLRQGDVYMLGTKLMTYSQYIKARKALDAEKSVEEAARDRLPEDSPTQTFGPTLTAFWTMQQLGYIDALKSTFNKKDAHLIMSLVQYMTITGGQAFDKYEDFSRKNIVFGCQRWTGKEISKALSKLSASQIHKFWRALNELTRRPGELLAISFDSTGISTYADIAEAAYGHAKQNPELPQINLVCGVNSRNGQVLYSETFEGSIPDVRAFEHNYKSLTNGIVDPKRVLLICDRGYKSSNNLELAMRMGTEFVMAVKSNESIIKNNIDEICLTVGRARHHISGTINGMSLTTEHYSYKDEAMKLHRVPVYYHAFLDKARAMAEQDRLNKLRELYLKHQATPSKQRKPLNNDIYQEVKPFLSVVNGHETFDEDKYDVAYTQCGLYFLCTSLSCDSKQVYEYYQDRNTVEVFFDHLKNGVDARRLRHQENSYQGFLFLATLAAGVRMFLARKFNQTPGYASSVGKIFSALAKLEVTTLNGVQTVSMVPAKVQKLMNNIGLYLDKESKRLLNITLPYQYID